VFRACHLSLSAHHVKEVFAALIISCFELSCLRLECVQAIEKRVS
jgi:hypothetical protein